MSSRVLAIAWLALVSCAGAACGSAPADAGGPRGSAGLAGAGVAVALDASALVLDAGALVLDAGAVIGNTPLGHIDPVPAVAIAGCTIMPQDSFAHADVRALPVHARSAEWIDYLGARALRIPATLDTSAPLSPVRYGGGFNTADKATPRANVMHYGGYGTTHFYFGAFPYPSPFQVQTGFDLHAIVVETNECAAYEFIGFDAVGPKALGSVRWDLRAYDYQPSNYSINVVGWPLVALMLRADEVRAGRVDHALSFVITDARRANGTTDAPPLWPAKRSDGPSTLPNALPMGAWLRLRSDVDLAAFAPAARVVAEALKVHGMLLGDSGGRPDTLMVSLEKSEHWTDAQGVHIEDALAQLSGLIGASQFEIVDTATLRVAEDSFRIH
jgi:hypothetical protein